jgi:hypothetical protein
VFACLFLLAHTVANAKLPINACIMASIPKAHAITYLRAVLQGQQSLDVPRVLAIFRTYEPTDNPVKLAAIHDPRASVTVATADYGSKCFAINGHAVSSKLRRPTSHALLTQACRTAIEARVFFHVRSSVQIMLVYLDRLRSGYDTYLSRCHNPSWICH